MKICKNPGLLMAAAMAGLLVGCASRNDNPECTASAAVIGGAPGTASGAAAAGRNPSADAPVGGSAGLAAGGGTANGMDQPAEAQRAVQLPPVVVVAAAPSHPLGIRDIKAMAKARVGDDLIISQINNSHSVYYLDAGSIIHLQYAGASDKVINCMINTGTNIVVTLTPPPPQAEDPVPAPGPEFMWIPGEWVWRGDAWVWIGGGWILPSHAHAVWIGPRWERRPNGWHRVPGYWR